MSAGGTSKHTVRRAWPIALALAALLAGVWFFTRGQAAPERVPSVLGEAQVEAPRPAVELAEVTELRDEAAARAEAANEEAEVIVPAADLSEVPLAPAEPFAFAIDAEPAVVEVRRESPARLGTEFVLQIEHFEGNVAAPRSLTHDTLRQPAFLDLEAHWSSADGRRESRRMLADIEYRSWWFEARGLEPGVASWSVDLGVCGVFRGRTQLEFGRNVVVVDLARLGGRGRVEQVFERFAPDDTWREEFPGDALAVDVLVEGAPSERPAPDGDLALVEFRRCEPWVELVDADGRRLAGFPLDVLEHELVPGFADVLDLGVARSSLETFGVDAAVGLRLVSGVPRPFAYETDRSELFDGTLRLEAALVARTPTPPRFGVLRLDLGVQDEAPLEVTLCFHGAHSCYLPPLAVARRVATRTDGERRFLAERLDLATLPLPLRVMVRADGCAPEFFDLEELLDPEHVVELAFEPGGGGVVVGAYQNNRAALWHFAPARGFDVEWRAGAETASAVLEVGRLGAMGWFEFRSGEGRDFDAAHLALGALEPNPLREPSEIAVEFADVAPGVVELWIRD